MPRADTADYRRHYRWGWQYSQRDSATLDYLDAKYDGKPSDQYNAALDGYLDVAAGRDMWHLRDCPDHDLCG